MVENTDGEIVIKKNTTEGGAMVGDDIVEGIKCKKKLWFTNLRKKTADGVLNEDYQELTVNQIMKVR